MDFKNNLQLKTVDNPFEGLLKFCPDLEWPSPQILNKEEIISEASPEPSEPFIWGHKLSSC